MKTYFEILKGVYSSIVDTCYYCNKKGKVKKEYKEKRTN